MEDVGAEEPTARDCPHCGTRFEPTSAAADDTFVYCPACGVAFPTGVEETEELESLRIRQVSTLRRGAIRQRSYLIIAVAGSIVAAVKLVLMTIEYVRKTGWGLTPVGYVVFVGVFLMLAVYFARRAMEYHRELQVPAPLPPVEGEPDFSTLSDGSQHWKNLEDIR